MKMLTAAVTSEGEVTDGGSHRILHRYGEEEIGVKLSLRKVGCSNGSLRAAPVKLFALGVACVSMWQWRYLPGPSLPEVALVHCLKWLQEAL